MRRSVCFFVLLALALTGAVTAVAADHGKVNLNTASAEQLQLLPRVGPAIASRIVDFRKANGPFKSADELVAVKGVGEKSLAALKPYLTVEGETTLQEKVKLPRATRGAHKAS